MITKISECPYCSTEIAFDWDAKAAVFNPNTGRSPCDHVIWVDGSLQSWSDAPKDPTTNIHWNQPAIAEPHLRAQLGDFFFDIELGAKVKIDAEYSCDLPTVANVSGLLDAFVVYAVDAELFLVACRAEMERYLSLG